jgi:hypothetical protein
MEENDEKLDNTIQKMMTKDKRATRRKRVTSIPSAQNTNIPHELLSFW